MRRMQASDSGFSRRYFARTESEVIVMNIVLIGLSHKTAPVEMRERLAFAENRLHDALGSLVDQEVVEEGLIVSTCNRVELLATSATGSDPGIHRLEAFACDFPQLPPDSLNGHLYRHADAAAINH